MFGLGWSELLFILLIVLLLFGARRLPEIARALGHSLQAFKEGMRQTEEDVKTSLDEKNKP